MKTSNQAKTSRAQKRPNPQRRQSGDGQRYAVDYMDHAPVWPASIFCQGLFKPTQNGAPAVELKLSYEASVGGIPMAYTFLSPQALNVVDQAVYFHLAQCIGAGNTVRLESDNPQHAVYRQALGATGYLADQQLFVIPIKLSDLAHGIGLTRTGTNAKSVAASLDRLSQMSIHRRRLDRTSPRCEETEGRSQFLAYLCDDRQVFVVLHFEAVWSAYRRKGVAWINMREHRSLPSKPSKRLHAWLSAWASPVQKKLVGLDQLLVNVWGDHPSSSDVHKDRKRTLQKAIKEVAQLDGWECSLTHDGRQLMVRKPIFAGTLAQTIPAARTGEFGGDAGTPPDAANTPTKVAATPTGAAETATVDSLEPAEIKDSDELTFEL